MQAGSRRVALPRGKLGVKLRAGKRTWKRGVCRSCQMNHRWRAYSRPATASRCSLLTLFVREDPRRAHLVLLLAVVVLYGVVPQVVGLRGVYVSLLPVVEARGGRLQTTTMYICLCTRAARGVGAGTGKSHPMTTQLDGRRRVVLHVALVELAARHANQRTDQRQDPAEPLDAVRAPRRASERIQADDRVGQPRHEERDVERDLRPARPAPT